MACLWDRLVVEVKRMECPTTFLLAAQLVALARSHVGSLTHVFVAVQRGSKGHVLPSWLKSRLKLRSVWPIVVVPHPPLLNRAIFNLPIQAHLHPCTTIPPFHISHVSPSATPPFQLLLADLHRSLAIPRAKALINDADARHPAL